MANGLPGPQAKGGSHRAEQNVTIMKLDNVPSRRISPPFARQEIAQQCLPMAASGEEQRTQSGFDRMIH